MYKILRNQKKRVVEGKHTKDNFIFLVEQAFNKKKITKAQYEELIEFEEEEKI